MAEDELHVGTCPAYANWRVKYWVYWGQDLMFAVHYTTEANESVIRLFGLLHSWCWKNMVWLWAVSLFAHWPRTTVGWRVWGCVEVKLCKYERKKKLGRGGCRCWWSRRGKDIVGWGCGCATLNLCHVFVCLHMCMSVKIEVTIFMSRFSNALIICNVVKPQYVSILNRLCILISSQCAWSNRRCPDISGQSTVCFIVSQLCSPMFIVQVRTPAHRGRHKPASKFSFSLFLSLRERTLAPESILGLF